jgi:mono/diheme cytochrome c family protein
MRILLTLLAVSIAAVISGAALIYFGVYNVAATHQHGPVLYWLLETAMRQSVKARAKDIEVPPLADVAMIDRGLQLYRAHCLECHGAPGVAPEAYAMGLAPIPANLAYTGRQWQPAELYWVVKHGIKSAGMPAWQYRLSDDDLWAIVAFMKKLPQLSTVQYAEMVQRLHSQPLQTQSPSVPAQPDPERGRNALEQYYCITCHAIPGVVGASVPVGPPLGGIATRALIAGQLPNTTDNMIRWLREPQKINPKSAMPDLGVNERDARDIAAYLYTLR